MKFKQLLLLALFLALNTYCRAQDNFNISLRVGERSVSVNAIAIDDDLIFLDRRGNILPGDGNGNSYSYYDRFDGNLQGKVKSINGLMVKYYDQFDRDELYGKVKSIGNIKFTYYDVFDRDELLGKLKSINGIPLKYYDIFGREELMGKLKSIGDIAITYYDTFGGSLKMGMVRAVKGKTPNVTVNVVRGVSADVEL